MGDWVKPHKHALVRKFHLLQLRFRESGPWVTEERTEVENAGRNFWNGKTKFGMKAEDVTDEIVGFRGDLTSSSQEVVINEHEVAEASAAD